MQTRVCGTDLSNNQYREACAIRISYIVGTDQGMQYSTIKTTQGEC